jgi:hypothetical protein
VQRLGNDRVRERANNGELGRVGNDKVIATLVPEQRREVDKMSVLTAYVIGNKRSAR